MAIVKMKKLRLMAVRSEKDRLLRELESFGCVEFSELSDELSDEGLVRESSDLLTLRNNQNNILNAIGLLDRYAPEKKPLLSAKPQVETETLLDDSILTSALEKAQIIKKPSEFADRIRSAMAGTGSSSGYHRDRAQRRSVGLDPGEDRTAGCVLRGGERFG